MKKRLLIFAIFSSVIVGGFILWHNKGNVSKDGSGASSKVVNNNFNKSQYSLDGPDSLWVVVNKKRALNPLAYAPSDLVDIGNGQTMRRDAASAFAVLLADAKSSGYNLLAESGYRSFQAQANVYKREVQSFGQAKADTESAKAGYSEHQTGWAVDIGSPGCYEDCFGATKSATWLKANAYKYGFLLRYPLDKADVTGYRNEPWHFRFIGKDLSTEMHNQNIETLEEFFELPAATTY